VGAFSGSARIAPKRFIVERDMRLVAEAATITPMLILNSVLAATKLLLRVLTWPLAMNFTSSKFDFPSNI
jgi:hypothetical protein